eukprot:GHVN01078721.1.p1 GENE.GHVN01078721.1~~GHVN01078721.1.p1  ORF type:complete len:231 (-),score=30.70 GHVN01078721.1:1397-2089(-)
MAHFCACLDLFHVFLNTLMLSWLVCRVLNQVADLVFPTERGKLRQECIRNKVDSERAALRRLYAEELHWLEEQQTSELNRKRSEVEGVRRAADEAAEARVAEQARQQREMQLRHEAEMQRIRAEERRQIQAMELIEGENTALQVYSEEVELQREVNAQPLREQPIYHYEQPNPPLAVHLQNPPLAVTIYHYEQNPPLPVHLPNPPRGGGVERLRRGFEQVRSCTCQRFRS